MCLLVQNKSEFWLYKNCFRREAMRIYYLIIALQLSLLMWVGAYYSAQGFYLTLNASHSQIVAFASTDIAAIPGNAR
ncbi:hypothetical protein J2X71_005609 [Rhizobium sp. 1399]|jgi:hypothetical protein|nr:hypothetical protein [Rhizobium sp. 1399]